jgi:hypothetical protein
MGDLPTNFDGIPVNHKRAIASLVCGLVGVLFLPIVLGIVAIVLGVQARQLIKAQPQVFKGEPIAMSGIVLGVLDIVAFFLIMSGAG